MGGWTRESLFPIKDTWVNEVGSDLAKGCALDSQLNFRGHDGKPGGALSWREGKLEFKGDVDAAARMFLAWLKPMLEDYIEAEVQNRMENKTDGDSDGSEAARELGRQASGDTEGLSPGHEDAPDEGGRDEGVGVHADLGAQEPGGGG